MKRKIIRVSCSLAVLGIALYAVSIVAINTMIALHGTDGAQAWDTLCQVEDCSQLPSLHMTYEVDGTRYYFPGSTYPPDPTTGSVPTFFGVLPIGHVRDESRFRRTIQMGRYCCTGWGPLDFDLYLETRADHTISRGFGRIHATTEPMRFGRGVLVRLPEYYGIDLTHPSGPLRDFRFYLHSRDSRLDRFLLNSNLRYLRRSITNPTPNTEHTEPMDWVRSSADLASANFPSFNDAFWIVADRRHYEHVNPLRLNGMAIVSKEPMLHGRHVYGSCDGTCRFYSLWFPDDPPNDQPLMTVYMRGDDIDALLLRSCVDDASDPACDPDNVSFANIRLRFEMVEQIVDALRQPPSALSQ